MKLPPLWTGTSDPTVAIMIRFGRLMLTRQGLWLEIRRSSVDGSIAKRGWRRIFPRQKARMSHTWQPKKKPTK